MEEEQEWQGRETQQPPGVCIPMGKSICNKTQLCKRRRRRKESLSLCGENVLLQMISVCFLAAVRSITITTPCCFHPAGAQPGWFSAGRGIKLSARIQCVFFPSCQQSDILRIPANFLLTFRADFFSSVLGVAVTHPGGLSSISARLLSLVPVCVFFMTCGLDVLHVAYTSPGVSGFPLPALAFAPHSV